MIRKYKDIVANITCLRFIECLRKKERKSNTETVPTLSNNPSGVFPPSSLC